MILLIGGVYLAEQDVYVDDIKVEKMNYYTIKFETNGGDKIDDIVDIMEELDAAKLTIDILKQFDILK